MDYITTWITAHAPINAYISKNAHNIAQIILNTTGMAWQKVYTEST